jgi:hypothetical protein
MVYVPDPLKHTVMSDRAALWCSADGMYCSPDDPCVCCGTVEEVSAFVTGGIVPDSSLPHDEHPDMQLPVLPQEEVPAPPPPEFNTPVTPQAEVRMVVDGDEGLSGEANG